MKAGRIIGTICVFTLSIFLLAGCNTSSNTTSNYPVGMKKKRVNYTAHSSKAPVVKSNKVGNPPPKNYVIPGNSKDPLYK